MPKLNTIFDFKNLPFTQALVMLTNRCNLECKHCFVSSSPHGDFGIKTELITNLFNYIKPQLNALRVSISGGEPLLRWKDTLELIRYFNINNHEVVILTNGTRITKKIAHNLIAEKCRVRISIDGMLKNHNSMRGPDAFECTFRGIEELLSSGFESRNLEFYSTITPNSVRDIHDILELADKLDLRTVFFNAVAPTGRGVDLVNEYDVYSHADHYMEVLLAAAIEKEWKCKLINGSPFEVLTIYSNGDVYPFVYIGPDDKGYGRMGNLLSDSPSQIFDASSFSRAIIVKAYDLAHTDKKIIKQFILQHEPR